MSNDDKEFENNLMHGYESYIKHFDKWCEYASSILGEVRQAGIIEMDISGRAFIVANCPDIGEQNLIKKYYDYEPCWSFYKNPCNELKTYCTQFGYEESKIYLPKFRMSGFYYREVINKYVQRIYGFTSNHPLIYEKLIQNANLVKQLIHFFKLESQHIIKAQQERKIELGCRSMNYFTNNVVDMTERDKFNNLLKTIGILDKDSEITVKEWQCLKMLDFGKSARQTAQAMHISKSSVESHFEKIKNKLRVDSKAEILEIFKK